MKKKKIVQKWLGITVVLACSSSVWAGFTDGFESGLGAWTTMGQVQVVTSEAPRDSGLSSPWLPTEGTHFASLQSTPHSRMYREFDGLAGGTFQFDYYYDVSVPGPTDAFVGLYDPAGTLVASLHESDTTFGWKSFAYSFPITGKYALEFLAGSAGGFEGVLGVDNVRVGSPTFNSWLGGYDAGLNTLPEQQGWTVRNNPPDTQPLIQNNVLYSKPTVLQYLYWSRTDTYICFPVNPGFVVEFELKINSSQSIFSSDRWRTGYSIWVSDYQGRTFRIGIADTGVIVSNDYDWLTINSSSFVPYNTTDGFHVYRFVVQNNIGQLQIDGNNVVSLGAGAVNATTPNMVLFGDATMLASHDAEMTYLRYGVITKTGDTDDNGSVDIRDLARIVDYWLTGNCGCMSCCKGADLNHSGKVDLADFALFAEQWMK